MRHIRLTIFGVVLDMCQIEFVCVQYKRIKREPLIQGYTRAPARGRNKIMLVACSAIFTSRFPSRDSLL